jgi:hypothetical protein
VVKASTKAAWAGTVAALVLAGCGVDRIDDGSVIRLLVPLDEHAPGGSGGAVRDERGMFDLEQVGVYVLVTVSAEDIEAPITTDWPDVMPAAAPAQAEIEIMVPAGSDRTIEVMALVVDEGGELEVFSGRVTESLPGGNEVDLEIALEPESTSSVDTTLGMPAGVEAGEVHAVHPVDAAERVLYPAATFTVEGGAIHVTAGSLPPARPVTWTLHTLSDEWVDIDEETIVP